MNLIAETKYGPVEGFEENGIRRIWAEAASEGLGVGYLLLDAAPSLPAE